MIPFCSAFGVGGLRSDICICIYIYMYVCICMYACINVCMHAGMYVCMYVCMYVRMYVCMYVCMHVRMRLIGCRTVFDQIQMVRDPQGSTLCKANIEPDKGSFWKTSVL